MTTHDSMSVFAALATELQHDPDDMVAGEVVVTRLRELVPEATWVGLTVRHPWRTHTPLAGIDRVAEEADALQHALGQGPALLVVEAADWIRSGEVATDDRWSDWGPAAAALGVRSMLTVALADRGEPLGAISLYSPETGGFADRADVDRAVAFAALAATTLTLARRSITMQAAVASRHVIGMAQGIVMARYGIDQQQSFDLLRRHSSTSNTKLRDLAARIVETRTVPQEKARELALD